MDMKKFRLSIIAIASVALGACTATNKSADGGENITPETVGLQSGGKLGVVSCGCNEHWAAFVLHLVCNHFCNSGMWIQNIA